MLVFDAYTMADAVVAQQFHMLHLRFWHNILWKSNRLQHFQSVFIQRGDETDAGIADMKKTLVQSVTHRHSLIENRTYILPREL
jgi:hypothetical protein